MSVTMLMYHVIATPENAAEARFCRTPDKFRKDMSKFGKLATMSFLLRECWMG